MTRIPTSALLLGLSGLLPFLWGALTAHLPGLAPAWLPGRFAGAAVLQGYGIVILSFMAGVIWGFGTRASGRQATLFYVISVLPPLWAFFAATGPAVASSLTALVAGFVALLAVDYSAMRAGLAPGWWMALRLLLTGVVAVCLLVGLGALP